MATVDLIPSKLPFLPPSPQDARKVESFMFYDLERRLSESWAEFIEDIFATYADAPSEAICNVGEMQKSGPYSAIRPHVLNVLKNAESGGHVDIQVRSAALYPGDGFLPCDISIALSTSGTGNAKGAISVSTRLDNDLARYAAETALKILRLGGTFYGHASRFPAEFGPDAYLSSVAAIPKGRGFMETRGYADRLTNWRRNFKNRTIHPTVGYFREVFPINLLTAGHINRELGGGPAAIFYRRFGNLEVLSEEPVLHMWSVRESRLTEAAAALESEGLLLSVPR